MGKPTKYEGFIKTDERGIAHSYDREYMEDFFRQNPNQRFSHVIKKVSSGKMDGLRGYWFAELIPKFIQGFKEQCGYNFDKLSCHDFIKQFSPTMQEVIEINGEPKVKYRGLSDDDWSKDDYWDAISELQQWGAENLGIKINDPGDYEL